jgi:hypothetical protein
MNKHKPSFELNQYDDRRPGFRILKTCGTCKYYHGYTKRGHCLHPKHVPENFVLIKPQKRTRTSGRPRHVKFDEKLKKTLLPVHVGTICERHEYKKHLQSLNAITRWCGARVQEGYDL